MSASDDPYQHLDADTLNAIRGLELRARALVEGYISGSHPSHARGLSVEFAEHREYSPGDDVRHVDWKVFGRTERYVVKQFHEDTNLMCWLVLDTSESMRYASAGVSKYDYAALIAAALAYLVVQQQDAVGLCTFDTHVRHFLQPSSQPARLKELMKVLISASGRQKTALAPVFHDLAERMTRRCLVVLLSDLFDDPVGILDGLVHFQHKHHDVIVFHILDRNEVDFNFDGPILFRGLEQMPELYADPRLLRQGYLDEINAFLSKLQRGCRERRIDYVLLPTDVHAGTALARFLGWRLRADRHVRK